MAVIFAAIQTGPGKRILASLGGTLASGNGLTVTVSDIEGFIPANMKVGSVTLADPHGEFARIEDLHLIWNPLALFNATLAVESLQAAKVSLVRKPDLPPAPESEDSGSSASLPLRIALDSFTVKEIDIAEPVAGQAATFGFTASARLMEPARGLSLSFMLDRRDAEGVVKGTIGYVPDTQMLDIDVQAREPEGGLVARLANMDGLPAVEAEIKGSGPIDTWNGTLNFTAGDAARITGAAGVRRETTGHKVTVRINADVQHLLPANVASLFEGVSEITAAALIDDDMRIDFETFIIRAAGFGVSLAGSVDHAAETADLAFNATGGDAVRFATLLPDAAWKNLHLKGTLRGAFAAPTASVTLTAQDFGAAGYGTSSLDVRAGTMPDGKGGLAWKADGNLDGLKGRDAQTTAALGEKGTFSFSGTVPANGAPSLANANVSLVPLDLRFSGRAAADAIEGALQLTRLDLAALSPLAGRPLQGSVTLDANLNPGDAQHIIRARVNGASKDVVTGIPAIDGLLGGNATLAGGVAYGAEGAVAVDKLTLNAIGLSLSMNGRIDRKVADLSTRATLPDLKRVDPRLEGRAEAEATFEGNLTALAAKMRLTVPKGRAMGEALEALTLHLDVRDLTGRPGADARLTGRIGGKPANGTGSFSSATGNSSAPHAFDVAIGSVAAKGNVNVSAEGLLDGKIAFDARDLSDLSALALTELTGTVKADLGFTVKDGKQHIAVNAVASKLRAAGTTLNATRMDVSIVDPAGAPTLNGKMELTGLSADALRVDKATLIANGGDDGATTLKLDTTAQGAVLTASARLNVSAATTAIRLDTFRVTKGRTNLALSAPATFTHESGALVIDRLALVTGGGSATVRGKAGETLDLDVDLRNLPLALAALADPKLDLSGTLSGKAKVSGPAATPNGSYDLTISRISMPDLARSGVGPLDVKAKGALNAGRVGLDIGVSGPSLSGVSVTGSVPMGAGAMDVNVKGSVALGIANAMLATSGARASGHAIIDAKIQGTFAEPRAGGTVRIAGARFDDTVNGVTLDKIEGVITGTDRSVTITSLNARTQNGGSVAVKGNVGLDPASGFPGKMDITLQNAGLVSSELMRLVADGQLALSGNFASRPRVTGRFDVRSLDINIPDKLPGGGDMLNVRHVNAGSEQDDAKRKATKPPAAKNRSKPTDTAFAADLDLAINADNNVFVRGMGVEAEMGGNLTLKGTSVAPVTVGAFEMRRGRFDVLGRRLDFTRGKVAFNGTTDPNLDFIAETKSADVTAKILISGPASQPQISFASTPELPQDEILARLLFNKSAGSLTASQAVTVAQTVAQFSGGGPGMLENVRRSLGVDSLDVGMDEAGTGGQVGVGKRLNDRVYLGVRQGTSPGSSKATIDIDIINNIRIQGATGADGGTETGISAQWDY
ncbi:translocation/assembly module TamB domain-containing protein [Pseudorhodoplanes sinuspersici]|uniref:translocation/assembly module TamB domain-containing protein n=1 Tax=Pseudorhodoplanes sinuspersici TaxID=1235591 RepID=UPI000FF5D6EC|nr:translocation/assembly module TamB domain-containing protein [Pseudorhodoplanes sinuspersici]RKE69248.1 autotransporter secretion inner membrane protein TamB [Pseudorhodoplanes sinuspersici]